MKKHISRVNLARKVLWRVDFIIALLVQGFFLLVEDVVKYGRGCLAFYVYLLILIRIAEFANTSIRIYAFFILFENYFYSMRFIILLKKLTSFYIWKKGFMSQDESRVLYIIIAINQFEKKFILTTKTHDFCRLLVLPASWCFHASSALKVETETLIFTSKRTSTCVSSSTLWSAVS